MHAVLSLFLLRECGAQAHAAGREARVAQDLLRNRDSQQQRLLALPSLQQSEGFARPPFAKEQVCVGAPGIEVFRTEREGVSEPMLRLVVPAKPPGHLAELRVSPGALVGRQALRGDLPDLLVR